MGRIVKGDIDCFLVDIGNVLFSFDPLVYCKGFSELAELSLEDVAVVSDRLINSWWLPWMEKGLVPLTFAFLEFRTALADCIKEKHEEPDQGRVLENFLQNFKFQFFIHYFGNMFKMRAKTMAFVLGLKQAGCKIIIVSNTTDLHFGQVESLAPSFFSKMDALILSHRVGMRKPEQSIWEKAIELSGVPSDRIFLIDDLEENVTSAVKAGIKGAVFTNVRDLKPELEKLNFRFLS